MAGSIRPRAASAVAILKKHGANDEAAAIASLLGPRGYLLLKRTEEGSTDPLSITVPELLKRAITETAEDWDLVPDALAEEAYRKVRDERWVPAEIGQLGKGKRGTKATFQVNVDTVLRREVRELLPELSKEAGYRVTEGNIVLTHLCEELGIERPNTAAVDQLSTRIPKTLREHFQREATARGLTVEGIVEDGVRSLLAGDWEPKRHAWVDDPKSRPRDARVDDLTGAPRGETTVWQSASESKWSEADRVNLRVRVDRELLESLRSHLDDLSEQSGVLVYPGGIIRAILTDRLGQPAE